MFFIIYLYILITYPYYEKKLLAFQKNLQAYRTVLLELPPPQINPTDNSKTMSE